MTGTHPRKKIPRSRHWSPCTEPDEVVFDACRRFLEAVEDTSRCGPTYKVAEGLNTQWQRANLTNQASLPLLWEGMQRGYLLRHAPANLRLGKDLADAHQLDAGRVNVIDAQDPWLATQGITLAGADLLVELAKEVRRHTRKKRISIGLGSGRVSMRIARRLAERVLVDHECPPLRLHALSSGFSDTRVPHAPITFFSFFDAERVDIEFVGLFAEATVRAGDFEEMKTWPGLREPFQRRDEIDIVVTSLGSQADDHTLFRRLLGHGQEGATLEWLNEMGWCGDVQFRGFSADGAILERDDWMRVVTLFEIEDLLELRSRGKYVVLLAGPCGDCGKTRSDALRPLLKNHTLRVFSHLLTDVPTALELIPPVTRGRWLEELGQRKTGKRTPETESDELLFTVATLFHQVEGMRLGHQTNADDPGLSRASCQDPKDVHWVKEVEQTLTQMGWTSNTRKRIHGLLYEALRRQQPRLVTLKPPRKQGLETHIGDILQVQDLSRVCVVPYRGAAGSDQIASAGAELVLRLLKEAAKEKPSKPRIHLGLGAGKTTMSLTRRLAQLAAKDPDCPKLTVHALTAGFSATEVGLSPAAFFRCFDEFRDVEYVGLYSQAIARGDRFEQVKQHHGVCSAFAVRDEIDVVVTSLASKDDEHGMLNRFIAEHPTTRLGLEERGWVGDVLFLPYSEHAPIVQDFGIRAVTLFELGELAESVRVGARKVVLLCGPCGTCGRTRVDALRPLLQEGCRVFSHLVLDVQSATELVERPRLT